MQQITGQKEQQKNVNSMHYYKSKCPNFHHQVHAYIWFEEFKEGIKNLALNKLWNIAIQEELVTTSFESSNHVLPTYEVFPNMFLLPVYDYA